MPHPELMHHPELMQHLLHLLLLMLPLEDMPQVQSSEISLQGHLHAKHSKIPSCSSADKLQRACVCVCVRERGIREASAGIAQKLVQVYGTIMQTSSGWPSVATTRWTAIMHVQQDGAHASAMCTAP